MNYTGILEVSSFLQKTLWDGLASADTDTRNAVGSLNNIVLSNPARPVTGSERRLSLWLYHIVINEHLRNVPNTRVDDQLERFPALGLNLWYLVTPSTGRDDNDQRVLGRVMQVLHDQSILQMPSAETAGEGEELHIHLAQRTIEEMAEVWEAMQQPYRLSICYEVRAVRIRSQREARSGRITDRISDFEPVGAGG